MAGRVYPPGRTTRTPVLVADRLSGTIWGTKVPLEARNVHAVRSGFLQSSDVHGGSLEATRTYRKKPLATFEHGTKLDGQRGNMDGQVTARAWLGRHDASLIRILLYGL